MIASNEPIVDSVAVPVPLHEIKRMRFELMAAVQGDLRGGEHPSPPEARPRLMTCPPTTPTERNGPAPARECVYAAGDSPIANSGQALFATIPAALHGFPQLGRAVS